MGFFTYLRHDDNEFVKEATVLTPSSQDAAYLATKAKDLPVADVWRTDGVATESLQVALAAAAKVKLVGLVNHNLTENAVVYIYGGTTSNPDGTEFQHVIPWRERDMFSVLPAAQLFRYWKYIIRDPGNTEGHLEVGYLLGGNATTLTFNFQYGWTVADIFESIGDYQYGVPNLQAGFDQVQIDMTWGALSKAQAAELRAFFRSLQGNLKPFFLIPQPGEYEGYFGRFVTPMQMVRDVAYGTSTQFLEDSKGLTILA